MGLLASLGVSLLRIATETQGLRRIGVFHGRIVYEVSEPVPLVGHIAFGVIDRGTNVIQVRPTTLCQHACIFCSVDAGPPSVTRQSEFMVKGSWLVRWVKHVVRVKGENVEILLDGVGEPLSHPEIGNIIASLKEIEGVRSVAAETHGGFLSRSFLRELDKSGLDRINLSIDATDPSLARALVGVKWYNVARILGLAEWALRNTSMDVVLTPVVVPGYNEGEMIKLVEWAKKNRPGEKSGWPTGVLIQKFEAHKYGRVPGKVKPWTWKKFYAWLREIEKKTGYTLIVDPKDLGFEKRRSIERPYRKGDKVKLVIIGPGWHKGELLAHDIKVERVMALKPRTFYPPGKIVTGTVIQDRDNIYLARA